MLCSKSRGFARALWARGLRHLLALENTGNYRIFARNHCSSCLRGHWVFAVAAPACRQGPWALDIAAPACLRGHWALEIAAPACLRSHLGALWAFEYTDN